MKPLTIIIPVYAIAAGIASGALFALVYHGMLYGLTAPLFPLCCLAFAGLAYGRAGLNAALSVTIPLVSLVLPLPMAALLIFLQIIPLNLCIRLLMTVRIVRGVPYMLWVSPAYAVSYMCMYLALFVSMVVSSNSTFYNSITATLRYFVNIELASSLPEGINEGMVLLYGITMASVFFMVASIFMTHSVLRIMGRSRRPHLRFAALDYPPIMTLAMVGVFLLLFLAVQGTSFVACTLAGLLVVLCAYFYTGLCAIHAVLHYLAAGKKKYTSYVYFILFYVYMIGLAPIMLPGVAVFGLVRHIIAIWQITRERTD